MSLAGRSGKIPLTTFFTQFLPMYQRSADIEDGIMVRVLTGLTKDKKPVTPELLKEFATASNVSGVAKLGSQEQAKVDAGRCGASIQGSASSSL